MSRIRVFLGNQEIVGADLEPNAEVPEALIELGRSMIELREGRLKPLVFNDSKKLESAE